MSPSLDVIKAHPSRELAAGEILLHQDGPCDVLHVRLKGEVEFLRDQIRVARIGEAGAVFGEMPLLLGGALHGQRPGAVPRVLRLDSKPARFPRR